MSSSILASYRHLYARRRNTQETCLQDIRRSLKQFMLQIMVNKDYVADIEKIERIRIIIKYNSNKYLYSAFLWNNSNRCVTHTHIHDYEECNERVVSDKNEGLNNDVLRLSSQKKRVLQPSSSKDPIRENELTLVHLTSIVKNRCQVCKR